MYNSLFLIPVTTGLIFTILGFIMLKLPPKKINSIYGYRTSGSMKNQETWNFAQSYSAKEMIKLGALLACYSLLGILLKPKENIAIFIGLALVFLMITLLAVRVEKAIKNKFQQS